MTDRRGPKVTLTILCNECMYERSEFYTCASDSGFHVSCALFEPPKRIGDSKWRTPDWCPLRQDAVDEFVRSGGTQRPALPVPT